MSWKKWELLLKIQAVVLSAALVGLIVADICGVFETEVHKKKDAELMAQTLAGEAVEVFEQDTEEKAVVRKLIGGEKNETGKEDAAVDTDKLVDIVLVTEESETAGKSIEELAAEAIDGVYGNGPDREAALGDQYKEVQDWIDANYKPSEKAVVSNMSDVLDQSDDVLELYEDDSSYYPTGAGVLSPDAGINYYYGTLETYYNLDMSGVIDIMYALGYSGDYWVRSDGVKMFGNYIMVAADFGWLPRGSVVECSLGTAMVCDTGSGGYGWLDIAVTW